MWHSTKPVRSCDFPTGSGWTSVELQVFHQDASAQLFFSSPIFGLSWWIQTSDPSAAEVSSTLLPLSLLSAHQSWQWNSLDTWVKDKIINVQNMKSLWRQKANGACGQCQCYMEVLIGFWHLGRWTTHFCMCDVPLASIPMSILPMRELPNFQRNLVWNSVENVHAGTFAPLSSAALNVLATMIGTKWETCRAARKCRCLGEASRVLRHIFANKPNEITQTQFHLPRAAAWRRLASARLRQPTLTVTWSCTKRMVEVRSRQLRKSHSPGQCATVDSVHQTNPPKIEQVNASPKFHTVRSLPFCLYDLWPNSFSCPRNFQPVRAPPASPSRHW